MVDHKVLITTSGIGSRLGKLTDFTNKSLVRIGDKPAISHIVEYYPKNTSFVVTLGHFGSYIKEFLTLAYPNRNFTFINVDNFKGPGSSLGHSILQDKSELQCPFIFHASDTILSKKDIPLTEEQLKIEDEFLKATALNEKEKNKINSDVNKWFNSRFFK